MRYAFLMIMLAACSIVSAQNNDYQDFYNRFKKPLVAKPALPRYDALRKHDPVQAISALPSFPTAKLLFNMSNGNKVYALPQDGMPCIVPDMNRFTIPNSGKGIPLYRYPALGAIPNPALEPQRIPEPRS